MPFDDTQRHALNHVDFLVEQGCNREDTEQQLNHSGFYKTRAIISQLLAYYDDAIFAQELAREEDTKAALRQTKHIVESGVGRKRVHDANAAVVNPSDVRLATSAAEPIRHGYSVSRLDSRRLVQLCTIPSPVGPATSFSSRFFRIKEIILIPTCSA